MRAMGMAPFGIALLVELFGGCRADEDQARGKPPSTAPAREARQPKSTERTRTPEQVEALLALPYAGWVEEDDEEGDGLVYCDQARSYPGYTLFTLHLAAKALLVDHAGNEVHHWEDPDAQHWMHVELLPDGDVLVVGADHPDEAVQEARDKARYVMRLDWAGRLVWKRNMPAHHDITTTPDGNLMTLTFRQRALPAVHATVDARDDLITTLTPQGEVLSEFSFYDAVVGRPDVFPLLRLKAARVAGRPRVDLFHANSLEWMTHGQLFGQHAIYGPDNVLVCFRHQHRVAIFDLSKREVIWAWGERDISAPHDAQMLENGHVLLFDNGVKHSRSRVIELDPLRNEIVWQFEAPTPTDFYTQSKGSAQRLPNGNTLIVNSNRGEIFEVTRDREVVWRYLCPVRNQKGKRAAIVRARRFQTGLIEGLLARPGKEPG